MTPCCRSSLSTMVPQKDGGLAKSSLSLGDLCHLARVARCLTKRPVPPGSRRAPSPGWSRTDRWAV